MVTPLIESSNPLPLESRVKQPLAELLRPRSWDDFAGLESIDKRLISQLRGGVGRAPCLVLWGPPGCGKTTFARLIRSSFNLEWSELSAVQVGVKEVRELALMAEKRSISILLFVDEIHRFNKSQQDAFLPYLEKGLISLIGATTENPSFYLNRALLSRMRVVQFKPLDHLSLAKLIGRAENRIGVKFSDGSRDLLASFCGGDGRQVLNLIEMLVTNNPGVERFEDQQVKDELQSAGYLTYDRSGDEHYGMASAFIKSLRGSDPEGALYWGFRMIEAGEDPRFVIRRMIIFASEDIGNADPRALELSVAVAEAFDRVGLPEGRIPISQCITYLASAPKSNRSYEAMHSALEAVKRYPNESVPLHLQNAPTDLMRSLGRGEGYNYAHNNQDAVTPEVTFLPEKLAEQVWYRPTDRGVEKRIGEYLTIARGKKR